MQTHQSSALSCLQTWLRMSIAHRDHCDNPYAGMQQETPFAKIRVKVGDNKSSVILMFCSPGGMACMTAVKGGRLSQPSAVYMGSAPASSSSRAISNCWHCTALHARVLTTLSMGTGDQVTLHTMLAWSAQTNTMSVLAQGGQEMILL